MEPLYLTWALSSNLGPCEPSPSMDMYLALPQPHSFRTQILQEEGKKQHTSHFTFTHWHEFCLQGSPGINTIILLLLSLLKYHFKCPHCTQHSFLGELHFVLIDYKCIESRRSWLHTQYPILTLKFLPP